MLNKKEKETLRSRKTIIEKDGENTYFVAMSVTKGELLALKGALTTEPTHVGADVRDYLANALTRADVRF